MLHPLSLAQIVSHFGHFKHPYAYSDPESTQSDFP